MGTVTSRAVGLLGLTLLTAGCNSGGLVETGRAAGFKANYLVARTALEQGEHKVAARHYQTLLRKSGPLEPRIRLEYAHALLREGSFAKAAEEARQVAAGLDGAGRAAALAVQGTAEHEQARLEVGRGKTGVAQVELLSSAKAALTEMLALAPDLDPTGGMKTRLGEITQELQAIL